MTWGTAPPGWYPDPARWGSERYWDGSTWTDRCRATLSANPYAAPVPPPFATWQPTGSLSSASEPPMAGRAGEAPVKGVRAVEVVLWSTAALLIALGVYLGAAPVYGYAHARCGSAFHDANGPSHYVLYCDDNRAANRSEAILVVILAVVAAGAATVYRIRLRRPRD